VFLFFRVRVRLGLTLFQKIKTRAKHHKTTAEHPQNTAKHHKTHFLTKQTVGGCSAAAPCDWAVMVGLMPAPAVDDVRRRPSPNSRPVGVRVAAPVRSSRSTLMSEGRYGLTSVIISEVRRSHNTAGGGTGTGGQNPPQGGAASAHRRGAQHTTPEPTAGGGQQAPTAGGHTTAGRGAPRGALHRRGH